jgi:acylglycerol lipase
MEHQGFQQRGTFLNRTGKRIFYRNWRTAGKPKGAVIIIHGLNSHSAYYHDFALQLNSLGIEVFACDLQGHGRSEGDRYLTRDFTNHLDDIADLVDLVFAAIPGTAFFMFGHCVGGTLAALYTIQHPLKFRGLILASCALIFGTPEMPQPLVRWVAKMFPRLRFFTFTLEDWSRDVDLMNTIAADPLLKGTGLPLQTLQQFQQAAQQLEKEIVMLRTPLLITHGTGDRVTSVGGSEYLYEKVSIQDKTAKWYEGHYHDLINDKYNGIVIRDINKWVMGRLWQSVIPTS